MIPTLTSNRLVILLVFVVVFMTTMAMMTPVQGQTPGLSVPMKDCLNEFRRIRNLAYSSHHLSEVVFCRNSAGQKEENEANMILSQSIEYGLAGDKLAAVRALQANNKLWISEILVLINKLNDPSCNVFMEDVISKLDMKQMKKNERRLRQKIDELHSSRGAVRKIVLDEEFYPYCRLMSFSVPEQLIEQLHKLLDNQQWAAKEYERIFEPAQRLNNLLSLYRRAQSNMNEKRSQLVGEFSVNVRWRMNNKDDRFLSRSIINGGFASLKYEEELGSLWKKRAVKAAIDVMRRRYGEDKSSPEIARLVGGELKPACESFVRTFKHVFDGFYIRQDGNRMVAAIADRENLSEIREFSKGIHTYLCCYLMTKGGHTKRFLEQIRNYDGPLVDEADHLQQANEMDGKLETARVNTKLPDTGIDTKMGSKHEKDDGDEKDAVDEEDDESGEE